MPIALLTEPLSSLLANFFMAVVVPGFFKNTVAPGHVEQRGPFEISLRPQRKKRPGAPQLCDFGPTKPSGSHCRFDCAFEETNPDHEWSIARRPWFGIEHKSRFSAAIPNGSPYIDEPNYLLVPAEIDASSIRYPHEPQSLDPEWVANMLAAATGLGNGWAVGWNTLGAGATVDHRHSHLLQCAPLPCEKLLRLTVGDYKYAFGWPAGNLVMEDASADRLWCFAERLQKDGVPFNILIRNKTAFVFGRRVGCELVAEFPAVMGLMELSGRALVSDASVYDALTAELLAIAMRKTTVSTEELFNIVR